MVDDDLRKPGFGKAKPAAAAPPCDVEFSDTPVASKKPQPNFAKPLNRAGGSTRMSYHYEPVPTSVQAVYNEVGGGANTQCLSSGQVVPLYVDKRYAQRR